jgi:uncharacterized protein (TIGR02001 family)
LIFNLFLAWSFFMKSLVCLSVVMSAACFLPLAHAEEVHPLTANISLTTKYKYRGQDQSNTDKYLMPAVQGGFDYAMKNGFYVGNWNSSIGGRGGASSGTEVDLYGGYKGSITKDLGYDVGLLQYIYAGDTPLNTTEIYGALIYKIFSLKYSLTASKDYFDAAGTGTGRGTGYLDFSVNQEVVKNITLNGHLGQ